MPQTAETLDVIARRFACRKYTGEPVPREILQSIAEAGLHAPSAINRQPWKVIVISDKASVDAIGTVGLAAIKARDESGYQRILSRGGTLLYNAPALMVVTIAPQPGPYPADLDAGIMVSHMALAATSLGINCCVNGMVGLAFQDESLAAKYIPEGYEFAIGLLLGYGVAQSEPHAIDESKIIWA